MKPIRVYISGPITGYPDANEEAFRAAAKALQARGHDTVVPHDIRPWAHNGVCPRGYAAMAGHSSACYLRADIIEMLQCDVVVTLPGWEDSVGARTEVMTAMTCGMPVWLDVLKVKERKEDAKTG